MKAYLKLAVVAFATLLVAYLCRELVIRPIALRSAEERMRNGAFTEEEIKRIAGDDASWSLFVQTVPAVQPTSAPAEQGD